MRRNTWRIVAIALVCALVGSAASAAGSATPNLILGTDGRDRIAATPATDVIYAKSGDDVVTGVGSGDRVYLSSGNDRVVLEPVPRVTNVLLDGNVGHDTFAASGLVDRSAVNGGSGNDVIMLAGCGNSVAGEGGNDKYTNGAVCPHARNSASLGDGNDQVLLLSATRINLGNGNDRLTTSRPGRVVAGSGNDRVTFVGGDCGARLGPRRGCTQGIETRHRRGLERQRPHLDSRRRRPPGRGPHGQRHPRGQQPRQTQRPARRTRPGQGPSGEVDVGDHVPLDRERRRLGATTSLLLLGLGRGALRRGGLQ